MFDRLRRALHKCLQNWAAEKLFTQKMDQLRSEVRALSLEEARSAAEAALSDPTRFQCVEASPADSTDMSALAPEIRGFFKRYAHVASRGAFISEIDRQQIHPSPILNGYLTIGMHVEHTELAVRPCDETI